MRSRFSLVDRVMARVLVTALVVMNGWSLAPFPPAVSTVSAQSPAQTVTFYGPQTFTRTKGKPNVFTVTVNVPAGVGGPFTLHVQNGELDHAAGIRHGDDDDDDDDDDEGGDRRDHHPGAHHFRVTKGEIAINGLVVATKADFRRHTPSFDKTVILTSRSTMTVTMRGKKNGFFLVSILGRTVDGTPPLLAVVAPRPNAIIVSRTPELVVSYSDPSGTGGASGVDPNTLVVRVDGVDRTSLFTRGAGQATAQLTQALADGAHSMSATIADRAGNLSSASSAFTVDGTAPTIQTIDPPAGRFVNTTTPTIRLRYSDTDGVDLSALRVLIGGQDRTSLFTPGATDAVATLDAASALAQGVVDLVATIRDSAGNIGTSSSSFVVDSVTPVVEIVQPGIDHYTSADAIDVSGTVTDASPSSVVVNGVSATVTGSTFTATSVPLGAGPEVALQVTVTDAAGNIGQANRAVSIDRVSPVVHIGQPIAGSFVSGATVGVFGTVSDASAVTVNVNGAPATVVNGSFTASVPAPNGTLTVQAVAEDAAGNSTTASVSVMVDSVAPVLTLTSPAEGFLTNQPTVRVAGTVTDVTAVTATLNGAPLPVADGAFAFDAPVSPGTATIAVNTVDAAGNASSAVVHGSVDRSAPVLQIVAPSGGAYLATPTPALRVVYQDNGALDGPSLRILVDGDDRTSLFTAGATEATATLPALTDGAHQVRASIRDAAGNETTASASFFTDVAGPTLQIGAPAANAFLKGPSVVVSGTVTDLAIASVTVNGQAATVVNGTFAATLTTADGPLAIAVVATDAAGNQTTEARTIAIDSVAPVVSLSSPAAGLVTNQTSVRVEGSATDSSTVTLSIGGVAVPVDSNAFSYDAPLTSDGPIDIPIVATDAAGNVANTTVSVTADRHDPSVQMTAPAAGSFLRGPSVVVTGTVSDASAASVTVNGVAATLDGSTFTATVAVVDGDVTLEATATDAAGNTSSVSRAITVDSAVPVLTVTTPASGLVTNQSSVSVQGTVQDATSVTLTIDGARIPLTSGAFAYDAPVGADAVDGAATFALVATDAAGNTSNASVSVIVDRTAPAVSIASPEGGAFVKGPTVEVAGSVSDAATTGVTVNGVAATLTSAVSGSSRTFTATVPVTDGVLTLHASALDAAGNTSQASIDITVDGTAPIITVLQPADGQYTNATVIEVSAGVTDATPARVTINGVEATASGSTFSATVPVGGAATALITIVATDAAGNSSQVSQSLRVDRVAPSIGITSPVAGAYRKGPIVEVSGTVADGSPVSVDVNGQAAMVTGDTFTAQVPSGDGPLTIVATAADRAGNTASAQRAVVVDSVAPVISVATPADGTITDQPVAHLTGAIVDASPVTLRVGSASVPVSSSATFAAEVPIGAEGANTITLRATDAAGNESTFELHATLDQTKPDLEITGPAAGALLGGLPIPVQGFVYDATATTVMLNGAPTTRVQDVWTASIGGLSEGSQTLTAVATDAAGNTRTVTRSVTLDVSAPAIAIASPAADALTNAGSIQVSGSATDVTLSSVTINGVAAGLSAGSGSTRTFAASVALTEGDNHLIAVAADGLGRASQAEVVVTRDSTPPNVSITSPDTLSRARGGASTITASDSVGLAGIDVTLNGAPVGSSLTAPFDVALAVPPAVTAGTVMTLVATATDRAGNTATATHTLRVISDGVVVGQVLSDVTGLPLAGASVAGSGGAGGSGGSGGSGTSGVAQGFSPAISDDRGGYSMAATDASLLLTISKDGMTAVERQVPVQTGVGTAVVDARLTPIAPATIVPSSGTIASGNISLDAPAGSSIALTPLSGQGLPALLPLGWSPLAAFDVRSDAQMPSATVAVQGLGVAQGFSPAIASAALVTYRSSTHGWFVVSAQVTVDANGRASFAIPGAGAYALVAGDDMTPSIPIPGVDQPLTGVSMTALPVTATGVGTITPATLPPAGGTASGSLAIQSPAPMPSGTIVQAQVTETYTLSSGVTASEEQRTEDIILYRTPAVPTNPESEIPNPSLSAFFPITPTRTYQTSTLTTGVVHLDILAGRESVRGQTGGSEPVSIDAGGGVTLTVPAHALPADTAVRVQPAILSSFLPGAAPNSAPPDVQPVGEVVVDFSSRTLGLSAELTVPAPTDGVSNVAQGFSPAFVVARVARIDGIPRLLVVARAEVAGDRLVSRSLVGLPGITVGGRYVFYRVGGDVGFVAGQLSASGAPVGGVIESDSLPFVGVAGADGRFAVAARATDVRLTGFVSGTALQGTATVSVPAGAITSRDIVLAGAVTTAIVTPADGATLVAASSQIEIAASAPLDIAAANSASITLTDVALGATAVFRRVVSGSGRVLAIIPEASLQAATTYRLDASGLVDVYGGAVAVPPVTFTTKADTAAVFDPEQVTVSFPDDNGIVHVTAPPGVVPPLTNVLVVNAGNGVVASFQAGNDGSMSHELTASIRDRLIVTITDPQGRTFSFERSTYVAADGTTGVGAGGGKVKSETTEAEIDIPEGAIDDSAIFKIDGLDLSALFPDDPSIAELFGATIGSSIKIEAPPDLALKDEAKLAFAKPAGAPADAFYFVYRRLQGPDGMIAYETIDEASVDPKTGKVTTASPPFSGYTNSIGAYGLGGVDIGGSISYMTMMYAEVDRLTPGRAAMGVISGKVLRQVFEPGSATPKYEPVVNAIVSGTDASGEPLIAKTTGQSAAVTQKDGTFSFFDKAYRGGTVTLSATTPEGDVKTATAYESTPQDLKSPNLSKYSNVATANITFPSKAPAAPPAKIQIKVFTTVAGALKETSVVAAGTPVTFGFKAENATVASASVQGLPLVLRPDMNQATKMPQMADGYTPGAAGSYTVIASATPPGGTTLFVNVNFRVIGAGGSATENLPNDPPAVMTALTNPRAQASGVDPTVLPQVTFTEPVKNVTAETVRLQDARGLNVPFVLSGVGSNGAEPNVTAATPVTSITIQPQQPLLYNTGYTLTLSAGIVDLDQDAGGAPAPKALVPYSTQFTTFGPVQIGQSEDSYSSPAVVVLGDRGYLAVQQPNQTWLKIYDVTDPTALREVQPPAPVIAIGYPYDLVGEQESPLTGERVLALTTGPVGVPYRPSNVFVYNAATDQPTWIGAVTLGNSPMDGVVRRTVLRDGVLYAATAGMRKGIQIVDLVTTVNNVDAARANGTNSREYYEMLAALGLEGAGFGQDAISNTIFVDTGSGDNSRLADLALGDLTLDLMPTLLVAATGARALVIVDPWTSEEIYNGRIVYENGSLALVWGYSIALTKVGDRDLAVLVGFTEGASSPVLVTVDVSNPRRPFAVGSVALTVGDLEVRTRLVVRDGIVYLGGPTGTTMVDIHDAARPAIQGIVRGLVGNVAFLSDKLMLSVGSPLTPSRNSGLRAGMLGGPLVILTAPPPTVARALLTTALPRMETLEDVVVEAKILPANSPVESGSLRLEVNNQLAATYTLDFLNGRAPVLLPAGTQFQKDASLSAVATVTGDNVTTVSPPRRLEIGTITMTLDSNNDTVVNDADDAARRLDKKFAFWQAAPKPAGAQGPAIVNQDAALDFATVRLRSNVALTSDRLRLKFVGDEATRWTLAQKAGGGKTYLMDKTNAERQIGILKSGCDEESEDSFGACSTSDAMGLPAIRRGDREWLIRCDDCPLAHSRAFRLEYKKANGTIATLDEVPVEMKSVQGWMTLYSAYKDDSGAVVDQFTDPVPGWVDILPAKTVNVLVHGFNVPKQDAIDGYPTLFKRLYWAGVPTLKAQDAHTVAIAWPGANKSAATGRMLGVASAAIASVAGTAAAALIDAVFFQGLDRAVMFPEDEFRAFETGVPLARLFDQLKADGRTLNILAHSLGNLAVNSAITRATSLTPADRYVMLEAAVAAEAFDADYQVQPGSLEDAQLVQRTLGATWDGFPDDTPSWNNYQDEWDLFNALDIEALKEATGISDNLELRNFYTARWRVQAEDGRVEAAKASPWLGIFKDNPHTVTMFNAYNTKDQALTLESTTPWWLCQVYLKPFPPRPFPVPHNSWLELPYLNATEFALAGRSQVRKWSELAFWFQPVSRPAGTWPLAAGVLSGQQGADRNQRMDDVAGDGGVSTGFLSHTYMTSKPMHEIWAGLERIKAMFERPPQ